jgi:hypothetical protein
LWHRPLGWKVGSSRAPEKGEKQGNVLILAHAGGLDEMAIILFPIVVGLGVWLLTRQPTPPNKD